MKGLAIACCLLGCAGSLNADERLSIRVSPSVAFAPAFVRVQATVERDAENRSLRIVAESDDFYRASEIPIDGDSGPRVRTFDFPQLPSGLYQVTGTLVGSHGQRSTAVTIVRVAPSAGAR